MNLSLKRCISVLLVSSLLVDPGSAASLSLNTQPIFRKPFSTAFDSQALTLVLAGSLLAHPILHDHHDPFIHNAQSAGKLLTTQAKRRNRRKAVKLDGRKGGVPRHLESQPVFTGQRLRQLANRYGFLWIQRARVESRQQVDLDRGHSVGLRIGSYVLPQSGERIENVYYLPPKYANHKAEILIGKDGIPVYFSIQGGRGLPDLTAWLRCIKIIDRQGAVLKVVSSYFAQVDYQTLSQALIYAHTLDAQVKITNLTVVPDAAGFGVMVASQRIYIPAALAKSLQPHQSAELIYDPSLSNAHFRPIEIRLGTYTSPKIPAIQKRRFVATQAFALVPHPTIPNKYLALPPLNQRWLEDHSQLLSDQIREQMKSILNTKPPTALGQGGSGGTSLGSTPLINPKDEGKSRNSFSKYAWNQFPDRPLQQRRNALQQNDKTGDRTAPPEAGAYPSNASPLSFRQVVQLSGIALAGGVLFGMGTWLTGESLPLNVLFLTLSLASTVPIAHYIALNQQRIDWRNIGIFSLAMYLTNGGLPWIILKPWIYSLIDSGISATLATGLARSTIDTVISFGLAGVAYGILKGLRYNSVKPILFSGYARFSLFAGGVWFLINGLLFYRHPEWKTASVLLSPAINLALWTIIWDILVGQRWTPAASNLNPALNRDDILRRVQAAQNIWRSDWTLGAVQSLETLDSLGARLPANGIAIRHRASGKTILFAGNQNAGKSASAFRIVNGQIPGIPKGEWELAAHERGQGVFVGYRPDQLFYMQHPEYDEESLHTWTLLDHPTRIELENKATGILPHKSVFGVDALVVFRIEPTVTRPTIKNTAPHSTPRRLALDALYKQVLPPGKLFDALERVPLIRQATLPIILVQFPDQFIPSAAMDQLAVEVYQTLGTITPSAPLGDQDVIGLDNGKPVAKDIHKWYVEGDFPTVSHGLNTVSIPHDPQRRMDLYELLIRHEIGQHPDWSLRQIADHLSVQGYPLSKKRVAYVVRVRQIPYSRKPWGNQKSNVLIPPELRRFNDSGAPLTRDYAILELDYRIHTQQSLQPGRIKTSRLKLWRSIQDYQLYKEYPLDYSHLDSWLSAFFHYTVDDPKQAIARRQEIVSAVKNRYRALMLQFHPDRNPGDLTAGPKINLIQKAYVLFCKSFTWLFNDATSKKTIKRPWPLANKGSLTGYSSKIEADLTNLPTTPLHSNEFLNYIEDVLYKAASKSPIMRNYLGIRAIALTLFKHHASYEEIAVAASLVQSNLDGNALRFELHQRMPRYFGPLSRLKITIIPSGVYLLLPTIGAATIPQTLSLSHMIPALALSLLIDLLHEQQTTPRSQFLSAAA
jgi:hypothetical protein